jgi:hypothetical protein
VDVENVRKIIQNFEKKNRTERSLLTFIVEGNEQIYRIIALVVAAGKSIELQ